MAKHSKKIIRFNFIDISMAEEFLELIGRKKMYATTTAKMNPSGKLELALTGSPENIKMAIQKLKKLHTDLLNDQHPKNQLRNPDEEELDVKFKLKKLKFEES